MSAQGQKPKPVAIRANKAQTALLKAASVVSYNPLSTVIAELSEQTGLPAKWISNWFGRQRTKARKNGEIIDLTTSSSASTSGATNVFTPASSTKIEEGTVELESLVPPSEDRSSPPPAPVAPPVSSKPAKVPRKRPAPRTRKPKPKPKSVVKPEPQEAPLPVATASKTHTQGRAPQLLPSVAQSHQTIVQSRLPIPPPTRSGMVSRPQSASIYSQNFTVNTAPQPVTDVYSSTGYFSNNLPNNSRPSTAFRQGGPTMRNEFRNSTASDFYSDPPPAPHTSSNQQDMDLESQRASSPAFQPDFSNTSTTNSTPAFVPPFMPATAQTPSLNPQIQQNLLNLLHSQALAGYTSMYNNNPGVYQAMLLNYAALFPAFLPAISAALTASGSLPNVSNTPVPEVQSFANPTTEYDVSTELGSSHPPSSPRLPPVIIDDDETEAASYYSSIKNEPQETPWSSGSDFLDFSGLHYDYAPLSHLQERLEPFRLPESTYLFGREEVANHLLNERLAVEEPFQAAMGLVLLSKLGLEW